MGTASKPNEHISNDGILTLYSIKIGGTGFKKLVRISFAVKSYLQ